MLYSSLTNNEFLRIASNSEMNVEIGNELLRRLNNDVDSSEENKLEIEDLTKRNERAEERADFAEDLIRDILKKINFVPRYQETKSLIKDINLLYENSYVEL